jgi:hypothetical protein
MARLEVRQIRRISSRSRLSLFAGATASKGQSGRGHPVLDPVPKNSSLDEALSFFLQCVLEGLEEKYPLFRATPDKIAPAADAVAIPFGRIHDGMFVFSSIHLFPNPGSFW